MPEKVKLSPAIAKAIHDLQKTLPSIDILNIHKENPYGWHSHLEPLNCLNLDVLEKALIYGYEEATEGVGSMKQIIKTIRKVDRQKQQRQLLTLDLDYELSSLFMAMERNDQKEIIKSKQRLVETQKEMEALD